MGIRLLHHLQIPIKAFTPYLCCTHPVTRQKQVLIIIPPRKVPELSPGCQVLPAPVYRYLPPRNSRMIPSLGLLSLCSSCWRTASSATAPSRNSFAALPSHKRPPAQIWVHFTWQLLKHIFFCWGFFQGQSARTACCLSGLSKTSLSLVVPTMMQERGNGFVRLPYGSCRHLLFYSWNCLTVFISDLFIPASSPASIIQYPGSAPPRPSLPKVARLSEYQSLAQESEERAFPYALGAGQYQHYNQT